MKRPSIGMMISCCLCFWAATVRAEEKPAVEPAPLADMKTVLPRYVSIMEAFGTGNLDTALDLIEADLPRPFPPPKEPFEGGAREQWQQEFQTLAKIKPKFESVEVVGYLPISSATRTLILIGHGEFGPVLFRFRVFRFQDQWKINGVSFQASWEQIEEDDKFTRFKTPLNFPLQSSPIVQTDED